MSIQHLYSLDPLYGLFEKARRLAGIYWVEDIKSNTSEDINGIYVTNLGDPFTDFDIDTISGGQVKNLNDVAVMGHFEYNDNINKIVFIPSIPLVQIKFTYKKYIGKKATSTEIKGKNDQITVGPDDTDPSSKIISLVDNVHLKGVTISDDNNTNLYSLPKTRGAPGSTLGIDSENTLNWTYPIDVTSSFSTSDTVEVSSITNLGTTNYSFKLKTPLTPGNYTLPTSSGTLNQILISKGPNSQAEWASPSAAAVTINSGENINVTHDANGYLISLKDNVNIIGNFSVNNKQFPSLTGAPANSALTVENGNMTWSAAISAGNNLSLNGKTLSIVSEPKFQGLSVVGQRDGNTEPLYYTFPNSSPSANGSIIAHDTDGTARFVTLSDAFGNEISNINGDNNITIDGTGNSRTVKLNNGIALGNVQINKTTDEIKAPKLYITESVKFGPYSLPTTAGGDNNVLLYDLANSQAKWAAPVNMPSGVVWFSGDNGITITPATVPAEPSTITISLNTIPTAKVRNLQMVDVNNAIIYSLPTSAGSNGQVLTASSNAQCSWVDPFKPTAGNGLVYSNNSYSLSNNITLNTSPVNADDEIKIQLLDSNSAVSSLIKSKNAHFQNITLGTAASNYTLPTTAGSSNKILGYDSAGHLGWIQRADAGVSAGNNITLSAESAISVVDAPLFSSLKIGPNDLQSYTLPTTRPADVNVDYTLNYKPDSTTEFLKVYDIKTTQDALDPINGLEIIKDTTDRSYDVKLKNNVNLDMLQCNRITVKKSDNNSLLYTLPTPISIPERGTGPETVHVACINNTTPTVSSWCKLSTNFAIISGVLNLASNLNITTSITTTDLFANSIKTVGVATEIKALSDFTVENKTLTVKNGNESVKINNNNITLTNTSNPNNVYTNTINKYSITFKHELNSIPITTIITPYAVRTASVFGESINIQCNLSNGAAPMYKLPNTTIPDRHDNIHAWGLIKPKDDPGASLLEFVAIQYKPYKQTYSSSYYTFPRTGDIINLVVCTIDFTLTSFNNIRTISFSLSATRVRYAGANNIVFDDMDYFTDFIVIANANFAPDSPYLFNETGKDTLNYLGVIPGIKYDAGGSDPSRCDFGLYIRQYITNQWFIFLKRLDNAKITQHELYKFGIDYDNLKSEFKSFGELDPHFTFVY